MKWILPALLVAFVPGHSKPPTAKATTPAAVVTGRVVGVTDGDSLTALIARNRVKVRIEGIAADIGRCKWRRAVISHAAKNANISEHSPEFRISS